MASQTINVANDIASDLASDLVSELVSELAQLQALDSTDTARALNAALASQATAELSTPTKAAQKKAASSKKPAKIVPNFTAYELNSDDHHIKIGCRSFTSILQALLCKLEEYRTRATIAKPDLHATIMWPLLQSHYDALVEFHSTICHSLMKDAFPMLRKSPPKFIAIQGGSKQLAIANQSVDTVAISWIVTALEQRLEFFLSIFCGPDYHQHCYEKTEWIADNVALPDTVTEQLGGEAKALVACEKFLEQCKTLLGDFSTGKPTYLHDAFTEYLEEARQAVRTEAHPAGESDDDVVDTQSDATQSEEDEEDVATAPPAPIQQKHTARRGVRSSIQRQPRFGPSQLSPQAFPQMPPQYMMPPFGYSQYPQYPPHMMPPFGYPQFPQHMMPPFGYYPPPPQYYQPQQQQQQQQQHQPQQQASVDA